MHPTTLLPAALLFSLSTASLAADETPEPKEEILLREGRSWDGTAYAAYSGSQPELTTIHASPNTPSP